MKRRAAFAVRIALIGALGALGALGACKSPEAGRVPLASGADVGNRPVEVQLHGGSRMYSKTPCLLPKAQCPGPLPHSGLPGDFPPSQNTK